MSIEIAVRGSQRLERLLEERLGAGGRGLHEKATSVQHLLPEASLRSLRWIASVRNGVVHEGATIKDVVAFQETVEGLAAELEKGPPASAVTVTPRVRHTMPQSAFLVVDEVVPPWFISLFLVVVPMFIGLGFVGAGIFFIVFVRFEFPFNIIPYLFVVSGVGISIGTIFLTLRIHQRIARLRDGILSKEAIAASSETAADRSTQSQDAI